MQRLLVGIRIARCDSMTLPASRCFATYTCILRGASGAFATNVHIVV